MKICVLCKVVDNFGDIGVVWRLCRQLKTVDASLEINLVVDDLQSFNKICSEVRTNVQNQTVDEIEHPAVRNAMKFLDMHELHIGYDADLPARSGLGSSSSFTVGMLNAFHALKGQYADKMQLAEEAIYVERTLCNESGGVQDQVAASFGGFNRIDFSADGIQVKPIIISKERKDMLSDNLLLFFTGFSRFSGSIAKSQEKATKDKEKELLEMLKLVDEAEKILTSKTDLSEFGRLLDYTWQLKRGLTNEISNNSIDEWYAKALQYGAVGGKLLGAGGGGFLLFYVEKDKQEQFIKAFDNLLYVPFSFEDRGTTVLYYKPEEYVKLGE